MTELELKHWLNRAFYADKKSVALTQLAEQYRERARGLTQALGSTGVSHGNNNSAEQALIRLADMEERCAAQVRELSAVSDEIASAISLLHDNDLEAVLIHRYLLFHTVEQTADEMHYSERTIKRKQTHAISKLVTLCPCFAPSDVVD